MIHPIIWIQVHVRARESWTCPIRSGMSQDSVELFVGTFDLGSSSFISVKVDTFCNGSQQVVCMAFFLDGLVQKAGLLSFTQNAGPLPDCAIDRDFIMLHPLSGGDQCSIANGIVLGICDHVFGFSYQG